MQVIRHCPDCGWDRLIERYHAAGSCPDALDGDCPEWGCTDWRGGPGRGGAGGGVVRVGVGGGRAKGPRAETAADDAGGGRVARVDTAGCEAKQEGPDRVAAALPDLRALPGREQVLAEGFG